MVEGGRIPVRRRMADFTLLGETSCCMVRIICVLEVCQVATDTARAFQVVVSIRMALGARYLHMRPGERESRLRMIKSCRLPA